MTIEYAKLKMDLYFTIIGFVCCGIFISYVMAYVAHSWPFDCPSPARMDGKTVLITGGSEGIGFETALELANRGARVIIANRQWSKGQDAVRCITDRTGNTEVYYEHVDLASWQSVQQLAFRICATQITLDVLINNAGIAGSNEEDTTEDHGAYDHVFAVNYLGHFLLVYQLMPLLIRSAPSRIVSVTSIAHSFIKKPLLDLDSATKPFHENLVGYDASKLAMVLHTKHLNRLLGGSGVTANCVHPGTAYTNLWRQSSPTVPGHLQFIVNLVMRPLFVSPKAAAQTVIYCAVADDLSSISGKYLRRCRVSSESIQARDPQLAARLWHVSMLLTGCVHGHTIQRLPMSFYSNHEAQPSTKIKEKLVTIVPQNGVCIDRT